MLRSIDFQVTQTKLSAAQYAYNFQSLRIQLAELPFFSDRTPYAEVLAKWEVLRLVFEQFSHQVCVSSRSLQTGFLV